jgi:hypothetical protein
MLAPHRSRSRGSRGRATTPHSESATNRVHEGAVTIVRLRPRLSLLFLTSRVRGVRNASENGWSWVADERCLLRFVTVVTLIALFTLAVADPPKSWWQDREE